MAMQVGSRKGAIAAINVTPLADVMIVLLIIFMVMTPILTGSRGLKLPPAAHAHKQDPSLTVRVSRNGALTLGDSPVAGPVPLELELQERLEGRGDRVVYVEADQDVGYPVVADVVDACRHAGAEQVALITGPKV